jgi:hypothetical protein
MINKTVWLVWSSIAFAMLFSVPAESTECWVLNRTVCTSTVDGATVDVTCTNTNDIIGCSGWGGGGGGVGGGGGWNPPGGGGGGGTSGGGGHHEDDTTEEMREQSQRCEEDDVQHWDSDDPACNPQPMNTIWCCLDATKLGHRCTLCDCIRCCYTSGYGSTDADQCWGECVDNWPIEANGPDDSATCPIAGGDSA